MKTGPRGIPGLAGVDGPRGLPGYEGGKGEKGKKTAFRFIVFYLRTVATCSCAYI